jgi:ergothioneine biosynthesis protein EgtB
MDLRTNLLNRFLETRERTVVICASLETEDLVVQPISAVSPPKWHLGHPSWFFEELLLVPYRLGYRRFDERFPSIFNSYYKSLGTHWLQGERGILSRPTVAQILKYRTFVDDHFQAFLNSVDLNSQIQLLIELGIHHEQQHQELLLMDIKYILGVNLLETRYSVQSLPRAPAVVPDQWVEFREGIYQIGYGENEFSFDNENPRHKIYLESFRMAQSLVTNGDYLEFLKAGGYVRPELWLSMGWDWVQAEGIKKPLYWSQNDGAWFEYTLHGLHSLDLNGPLVHISYFEADAFARWKKLRLPTEAEFEVFLEAQPISQDPSEQSELARYHPTDANAARGQVWCWTQSQYTAYPGYRSFHGAIQEYNGKFMCNQFVLRGSCVATPLGHYRDSYRNFYLPEQRWMFSGIRLAKDLK